jgi:hypothetical protein
MGRKITRREFTSLIPFSLAAWAASRLPHLAFAQSRGSAEEFRNVPNSYRMRMHWYVFGPAWEPAECDRQLSNMAAQHIGGVLIFPAYPIALDDPARGIRNVPYLSPEFLSVLSSVTESARQLGMTVDIVLGTGWPYGGPSVTVPDSAHMIRMRSQASVQDGDQIISSFGGVAFVSAPTRMQVKRAALGAEGLIVDHYSREALDRFLAAVGDKLLGAVPAGAIRSIFCDSFEVYRAIWTAKLPQEFSKRRGYDLLPHLPALFDASSPNSKHVRHDFWQTLSELAIDEFVHPLQDWAHRHGVTTQVEAYGSPPVSMAAYRYVDVPVGEHYEWKEFSTSRWASSGAHLAGKTVVLAEAWTWTGIPDRFSDTLEDLKLCSDLHFLCGINALYGLTYAYSPTELGSPGWVPYFGPAVNHTSPYWPYFSHLADYVNRASYVLQQGKPVAEVGLYLPTEDVMADAPPEQLLLNWAIRDRLSSNGAPPEFGLKNALHYESDVVKTIVTNGYAFDGVDAFTLSAMEVRDGHLCGGDCNFRVLILPNLTGIDVASLRKIEEFVKQGGVVIATRRLPDICWGLQRREENAAEVRSIVSRIFGAVQHGAAFTERSYGKGRALFVGDELGSLREALRRSCPPDIHWGEASSEVGFVHRRAPERHFYFIANTSPDPQRLDAEFRTGPCVPELWNLMTGEVEVVPVFEATKNGVRLRFTLGPFESRVYSFIPGNMTPVAVESDLEMRRHNDRWVALAYENGSFSIRRRSVRYTIDVAGLPAPLHLAPVWRITFEGLNPAPIRLDTLKSWTDIPEVRFFSGRAIYEAEFDNSVAPSADLGALLDLGRVRETADVSLNGKPLGVAWMRPYRLDISAALQAGRNQIRIAVTNLPINKILGDGPIDYSAVFAKYGNRFPSGDEWYVIRDPLPSGLLGPVRIQYYRRISVP